jgi:hypothetical protein
VAVLAALGLGLSACGAGSASPGVVNVGSTPTTRQTPSLTGGSGVAAAKYATALAYVNCMRSHGVANFPDPPANGTLNVTFAMGGKDGSPRSSGINRNSSRYISAYLTCQHLLPGGVPTAAQNQEALTKGVEFAECMRSHGMSNFPDPTTAGVVRLGAGVDPGSPQFQSAQKKCQALVPGSGTK